MIQTIGKILVILLVTALVAGGLYALVQGTGANSAQATGGQFDRQSVNGAATRPEGFREHDREGSASFGRGMGGLLVSLLQIGAITFIVLQVQKVLAKNTARRDQPDPV